MIYAILIWIIAIFSIVWISYRGYASHKIVSIQTEQNESLSDIQTYVKKSIAQTALIILFAWWVSFILLETMKLKILDYETSYFYETVGILSVGFVLIAMHLINNRILNKKYNVRIYDKSISIERTLCVIISLVYALIASYAVEAFVIFTT